MAGGYGSQALVATVAARHDIPHVCVPAGTRNHFALDLGLDREDVVGALDAFSDGVERRIDLATVNGRTFVNNASLGVYARVVQSPEYRAAKLKTALAMLPDLVGPAAGPMELSFAGPDATQYPAAQMILVSNNPYQLVHAGGRGTRERMDTGLLGIAVARIADAAGARRFVTLEMAGQARRFPGWLEWAAAGSWSAPAGRSRSAWMARPWSWTRPWSSSHGPARCGFGCRGTPCSGHRRPVPSG